MIFDILKEMIGDTKHNSKHIFVMSETKFIAKVKINPGFQNKIPAFSRWSKFQADSRFSRSVAILN